MSDVLERVVVEPLIRHITKEVVNIKQYRHELYVIIKQYLGNDFIVEDKMTKLPLYVHGCYLDDTNAQLQCTRMIRKILSTKDISIIIKAIIDTGIVPQLVQFLDCELFESLQCEAAWCLTNIATGTSEHTKYLIECGTVPKLIKLIESKSNDVKQNVVVALGNIAGDSVEHRNYVLSYDILNKLFYLFQKIDIKSNQVELINLIRNATWTVCNLCREEPTPETKYVELAIRILSITIQSDDDDVLKNTCWGLSYLSVEEQALNYLSEEQQPIKELIHSSFSYRLVELLDHANPIVRRSALRTIGNIMTGPDYITQQMICDNDILPILFHLITGNNAPITQVIRREACWVVSNITSSNNQIGSVLTTQKLIWSLINVLKTETFEVSQEALWAICNVTSNGTDCQVQYLVNQGVIKPLCTFFNPLIMESNEFLLYALEGICNILAVGLRMANGDVNNNLYAKYVEDADGVTFLKQIQVKHGMDDEIYIKAAQIISKYFGLKCGWVKCAKDSLKIKIKLCKGCMLIGYCCRNHQKKDWVMMHSQQCLRKTL